MSDGDDGNRLDLGEGHTLVFVEYRGDPKAGANVLHQRPDGTTCHGWISFAGRAWAKAFDESAKAGRVVPPPTWIIDEEEPLTVSPSLLCRACGDHGWIRQGKWVKA